MGLYNTYGTQQVQLKVGHDLSFQHYDIGDRADLADGVYVGYEGAAVVQDGKLIGVFDNVQDKWGCRISIDDNNPIKDIVNRIDEQTTKLPSSLLFRI